MQVTNSTFYENDALTYDNTFGGAICVAGGGACAAVGGVACEASPILIGGASMKLTNSTFEHNYAENR